MIGNITETASKASLPVTVSGATFLGYSVPDLVQYATLIWLALLMVDKLWSMYRKYKGKEDDQGE